MKLIKVPISLIRSVEESGTQRIGQAIVNANPKPASLMLRDEIDQRRTLFYMDNVTFWKEYRKYVEIDWSNLSVSPRDPFSNDECSGC